MESIHRRLHRGRRSSASSSSMPAPTPTTPWTPPPPASSTEGEVSAAAMQLRTPPPPPPLPKASGMFTATSSAVQPKDAIAVRRRVRCPRCHSVLEEPGACVYQCGGCGTTLRGKNRTSGTEVNNMFPPSRSGLLPQTASIYQGQDSIDHLSIDSPKPQADAALAFEFEILEEPDAAVYPGQDYIDRPNKDVSKLQVDAAQFYQVSGRSTTERDQRCRRKPGAQVYQESGCGTNLRAKSHTGSTGEVTNASSPRSGPAPRRRHYCRPILKGAPFIVCSSCFKLLQVPIDFAVTNAVGKLQCGFCSSVLTYSYRDPTGKKPYQDSVDQLSTESSEMQVDAAVVFNNLIGEVTCCESSSKVDELHYTPYKDAMIWGLAMGKQRRKGQNHTFMQQDGHKLLGRDEIRQNIMEKILLDRDDGSNCAVFCINGESGFGKTSLLSALYNDEELLHAFDKRIWIQMSEKIDVLMLFRKIIEFVMNDHCSIMSTNLLQELLMEEITDEKLLLILDDADTEDQQFWNSILEVLNVSAKGSVIIMATKSCAVATLRDVTYIHFLNPLSEENKLMIFQQYSGVGTDIQNNPDLVMVAKRFISRFGYNLLHLKAIAGLLCHTDTLSVEEDKFEGSVMPLWLCHDALPVHLKRCLAFCLLFPEGYIFDKHYMVLLWISHGCVRPVEGHEPEDVGTEYFNELLCRSFFQYSPSHDHEDNKFVMHELIYDVVVSVSHDKYFKSEDLMCRIPESIIHCSLISSQFQTVELMHRTEQLKDLQTFLSLQPERKPNSLSLPTFNLVGLDDFFLKFTSLEILDLSHTETEELPGSICGLKKLRYFSINSTNIRALPSELCSLSNLQTLEAKHCRFLTELPRDIKKLVKLRHLDVMKELDYVHLPHGIGELTELQTLPVFHVNEESSCCSISELGNLPSLRGCLCLSGLGNVKTGSKAQEANLKDKHRLKDLTLQWHDNEDQEEDTEDVADEQVLESLQPYANLQVLAIRGYKGTRFPAWMQGSSSLPNLMTLTLDNCCNCTEFPTIAHLPSLKFLSVRKMYDVQRLSSNNTDGNGTANFPSLELLNLWEMYGLEELFSKESEGDCPRLRKVCISRCPNLKRLPRAPSLTELVLHCGHQLPDISELASLVSLKIEGFHRVRSFVLPAAAAALRRLEIRSCKELVSVDGLSAALTTVRRIKIAGCPKLVLPGTSSSLQTT